jgi:uncharacterized protein YjbI with pentapeptide repeats
MTPIQNISLSTQLPTASTAEEAYFASPTSMPALFGGRETQILLTSASKVDAIQSLFNGISSSSADLSIEHASIPEEVLRQNNFQQAIVRSSSLKDKLYTDVYSVIFSFLPSLQTQIALVNEIHRTPSKAIAYSKAMQIASEPCKELSDADMIDLIEMAPTAIPPSFRKKVVLGALNPKLLTKLTLKTDLLDADDLKRLLSKSPKLRKFDLVDFFGKHKLDVFFQNFFLAITTNPNFSPIAVKELCLTQTKIDEASLKNLLINCSHLETLELISCKSITCESLADTNSLEHLKTLNLTLSSVTEKGVHLILSKCLNLESLDLSGCESITGESLANMESLKKLKILILGGLSITQKNLNLILSKNPYLQILGLSECKSITDESLTYIMGMEHLKELKLSGSSINEQGLHFILQKCPHLESLDLSDCKSITGESLANVDSLKYLKVLKLRHSSITEKGLNLILQKCSNLTKLDISYLELITGDSWAEIKSLKNLKEVNLDGSSITEKGLSNLLIKGSHLKKLNLSMCKSLTGKSLTSDDNLKNLEILSLWNSSVTVENRQLLRQNYPNLKIED